MEDFKTYLAKSSNESLNEAKVTLDVSSSRFDDSGDATSFMYGLQTALKSKALVDWAKATDMNFDTSSQRHLRAAVDAYEKFIKEIEKADE